MKIAFLINSSLERRGGFEVFSYNLAHRLAKKGHEIVFYVPSQFYFEQESFYRSVSFEVRPIFFRTFGFIDYAPWVIRLFLRYEQLRRAYDVWQVIGTYPAGYLAAAALKGVVPVFLRAHGEDIQKVPELNYGMRLKPNLETKIATALADAHTLVALTQTVQDCFQELGVPQSKIEILPNGVDFSRFQTTQSKSLLKSKLGLPEKTLILTVGRNHIKKGFDTIPVIAKILKDRGFAFQWLVIGPDTTKLAELVTKYAVEDSVGLIENLAQTTEEVPESAEPPKLPTESLLEHYQAADVFAFPSRLETFGMVLIEAMASGVPVVTTNAPGCRDVVVHNNTGLVAPVDDTEAFAVQISRLLQDSQLYQSLVSNGRTHAAQHDWDSVIVPAYEEMYRSTLA